MDLPNYDEWRIAAPPVIWFFRCTECEWESEEGWDTEREALEHYDQECPRCQSYKVELIDQ